MFKNAEIVKPGQEFHLIDLGNPRGIADQLGPIDNRTIGGQPKLFYAKPLIIDLAGVQIPFTLRFSATQIERGCVINPYYPERGFRIDGNAYHPAKRARTLAQNAERYLQQAGYHEGDLVFGMFGEKDLDAALFRIIENNAMLRLEFPKSMFLGEKPYDTNLDRVPTFKLFRPSDAPRLASVYTGGPLDEAVERVIKEFNIDENSDLGWLLHDTFEGFFMMIPNELDKIAQVKGIFDLKGAARHKEGPYIIH